jgi:anti-sigma factor RsiW
VNPSCRDLQPLLSLRAAGALAPDEAGPVEAHLAGCPACRAEVERDAEVLGLAALPPLDEAERRALSDLPARTLAALRLRGARRARGRMLLAVTLAAAAVLVAIVSPAYLRNGPGPAAPQAAARADTWQEPDMTALWDDSAELDTDTATAQRGGTIDDAALAALDAGVGE